MKSKTDKDHFPKPLGLPIFKPGDAVVLWSDSRNPRCRKEYGRVICSVWNSFIGTYDVYVAFFGFSWPKKVTHRNMEKPYVLRYFETSLKRYEPKNKKATLL